MILTLRQVQARRNWYLLNNHRNQQTSQVSKLLDILWWLWSAFKVRAYYCHAQSNLRLCCLALLELSCCCSLAEPHIHIWKGPGRQLELEHKLQWLHTSSTACPASKCDAKIVFGTNMASAFVCHLMWLYIQLLLFLSCMPWAVCHTQKQFQFDTNACSCGFKCLCTVRIKDLFLQKTDSQNNLAPERAMKKTLSSRGNKTTLLFKQLPDVPSET